MKYFSYKNHAENEAGRLVPDLFLYFKKTLCEIKARVSTLMSIYVGSPRLRHTIKVNCIKCLTIDPGICSILIFKERVWD